MCMIIRYLRVNDVECRVPATFPANSPQEASRQKRRPHLPVWRDTHFQRLCTPSRCLNAIRLFAYSGQRHSACRKHRYPLAWWSTLNLCSIVALTVMIWELLMYAFICLWASCRWCPTASPAFRRCKVTTRFPFLQEVSDLTPHCFRPGVWHECPFVCARSHAYRSGRGTPAFLGPGEEKLLPFCCPTGKILLPSWETIFFQLGSSAAPFRVWVSTVSRVHWNRIGVWDLYSIYQSNVHLY